MIKVLRQLVIILTCIILCTVSVSAEASCTILEIKLPKDMQEYIFEICGGDVELQALMLAIIEHESRYTVDAIGYNTNGTRDWGYGQINDANFDFMKRHIGITKMRDLLDGKTNIRAIKALFDYHGESVDTLEEMLFRYQIGEGRFAEFQRRGIHTNKAHQNTLAMYAVHLDALQRT